MSPQGRDTAAAHQQGRGAQHQHDQLQGDSDGEDDQRQNHEGNAGLGEHGRKVGNRQRLPEQDAAIAAFSVERIETVEDYDDERGQHEQHGCVAVGHGERGGLKRRVDRRQSHVLALRRMNEGEQEAE